MIDQIANRYKISSLIGQGGMADVYKAYDTILNREVAIKVLRSKIADDAMTLVRFQREASAASRFVHPNVVDIYDVGESDGLHYIVMEYIRGRTLKQLISQRGALDYHEALGIMKQLTSAIVAAHENHIIHRDIKPQNVLIKDDGTAKLTDFGIAIANDSVQLTYNNAVMGSAHYLAPETAQGKEPNPKIDIYSLGIVFYELLTGEVPFRGKTPTEIALKHLKEKIPFPRLFNPHIPQSVENIILKATAKDPKERYDEAKEMLYDLEHCLDPEYRNMKRLKLKSQTINMINVEKGHVEVEYVKEKEEKETSSNWLTYFLIGTGIVISLALILLVGSITGVLRFSGFLGYETMPDIVYVSKEEAIEKLKKSHFSMENVKFIEKLSETVESGNVIEVSYNAGEIIARDSKIEIVVSKGPGYEIEDYSSWLLEDVRKEFMKNNLDVEIVVKYQAEPNTNPGVVIDQEKLLEGDVIDPDKHYQMILVVAQYPSIVLSEDLIGMDVDDAKKYLNDLGIAVMLKQTGYSNNRQVVEVSPEIGTKYVQEGTDSVVTLFYD